MSVFSTPFFFLLFSQNKSENNGLGVWVSYFVVKILRLILSDLLWSLDSSGFEFDGFQDNPHSLATSWPRLSKACHFSIRKSLTIKMSSNELRLDFCIKDLNFNQIWRGKASLSIMTFHIKKTLNGDEEARNHSKEVFSESLWNLDFFRKIFFNLL